MALNAYRFEEHIHFGPTPTVRHGYYLTNSSDDFSFAFFRAEAAYDAFTDAVAAMYPENPYPLRLAAFILGMCQSTEFDWYLDDTAADVYAPYTRADIDIDEWDEFIRGLDEEAQATRSVVAEVAREPCRYCGGDCPYDEECGCDGYLGDPDGLYPSFEQGE